MAHWVRHCSIGCLFLSVRSRQMPDHPLGVNLVLISLSALLLRVPSPNSRLKPFRSRHYLPRFLPFSRHHRRNPLLQSEPNRLHVPSSDFLSLSTVSSSSSFAGLFHPAATSRISVQGFLSPRSYPPFREEIPPCR